MATLAATRADLLLLSTLSLWVLHTIMPVLQKFLPSLSLTRNSQLLSIPLAQALNQVVGLLTYLFAYSLLHQRAAGKISLRTNLLFLTFGFLVTTGHGMHTVCVLVEEKVLHLASIHALVDLLHEVASHNMFVAGLYCLMGLLMKTEQESLAYKLDKKHENSNGGEKLSNGGEKLRNGYHKLSSTASSNPHQSAGIAGFLLQWTWPVILGVYFSIFSCMTGTAPITVLFYIAIYAYTTATAFKLAGKGLSLGEFFSLLSGTSGGDLTVFGTIVKASCIGLPVLALWYMNIIQL